MTSPITSPEVWHTVAEAAAPFAAHAAAAWAAVIAAGVLRLLMEWQLRRTLAVIFQQAPGGSVVVVRKRGLGGTMWIQVGPRYTPTTWASRAELT